MSAVLVSFASPEFEISRDVLAATARAHGVATARLWDPTQLRATAFYHTHRRILDAARGCGYWLWKPFIILEALKQATPGQIVMYADAGLEITGDLARLFSLCRDDDGVLLFRGPYDGIRGRPNTCEVWTKRDCFVAMECDDPVYRRAPMLDASLIVLSRTDKAMTLVHQWLSACCDTKILTDAPSTCGLAEYASFIEHRHDQSVLSLLAQRSGIRLHRSPSQFGNHLKAPAHRVDGEWRRMPYVERADVAGSDYGTLVFHHRKQTLLVPRVIHADSPLTATHAPMAAAPDAGPHVPVTSATLIRSMGAIAPGARILHLGSTDHCLPGDPAVEHSPIGPSVGDINAAGRKRYDIVISDTLPRDASIRLELMRLQRDALLNEDSVVCWTRLEGVEGWAAFRDLRLWLSSHPPRGISPSTFFGFVAPDAPGHAPQTIGLVVLARAGSPLRSLLVSANNLNVLDPGGSR